MNAFPDTSFLCALYRRQDNSTTARKHYDGMTEPLHLSALLLYEFRQAMRFQSYRHAQNRALAISAREATKAMADMQANLGSGAVVIAPVDWAEVLVIAERLSAQHTPREGHRALDVLQVATALHLGAREFLSFDANQRQLAVTEGLVVRP